MAAVAIVYLGAALLTFSVGDAGTEETVIWAPSAVALAALMRGGGRLWPGVAAGALVASLARGLPPLAAAGIAAGSTLEALLGAAAVRRIIREDPALARLRSALALVLAAAAASTL